MKNLLMSASVGDIAGSAYEGRAHRTKDYYYCPLNIIENITRLDGVGE